MRTQQFLRLFCLVGLLCAGATLQAAGTGSAAQMPVKPDLVVAKDGSGDFTSVHAAVQSIPKDNHQRKIILIKDGLYDEKVRVDASCVTLHGESRTGTRIEAAVAQGLGRSDGRGQAVVNLNGDDAVLENLTIKNTHGVLGVHAFAVYGRGDRTVIQDADVLSQGNDTISLWRTGNGQFSEDAANHTSPNGRYYHARLKVCGSVDFICPRGWCYMTDSEVTEMNPRSDAAMWHDGSRDKDMKFVMVRCRFEGPENFRLARHHHDAMFFFIDCSFSKTMCDIAPYRVIYPLGGVEATDADRKKNKDLDATNRWGERAYFFNSHREGGDYAWHNDNLSSAPAEPTREQISAKWAFDGTWDPERSDGPRVVSVEPQAAGKFVVTFSEPVTAKGKPRLALANGEFAEFVAGSGTNKLEFSTANTPTSALTPKLDLNGGAIIACDAGAAVRVADLTMP
jgi:pectinesterase